MEHQSSGRAARVDRLIENDEVDGLGFDFLGDLCKIENRAREAVEPRDDELVAVTNVPQRVTERRSFLSAGAAFLLFKDALAAISLQLVELDFQLLPRRGDAGISDLHVLNVLRDTETAN